MLQTTGENESLYVLFSLHTVLIPICWSPNGEDNVVPMGVGKLFVQVVHVG